MPDGPNIIHQICFRILKITFLPINYYFVSFTQTQKLQLQNLIFFQYIYFIPNLLSNGDQYIVFEWPRQCIPFKYN